MTLAYPALGGAFAAHPRSDQYIAGYAFREFAAQSLRAGQGFPQWDAYLFGGMPYIAAMHGDIFYPTFLLRMILPTDVAMTWGFIIHMILAGFFTYGFLRALGLRFQSSLIGGLAYMMSGPIAAYVSPGHDGKLFVSALMPLALWMLIRWVRDGRYWAVGALAIVIGLGVLSPHPQLLQYLLLASGSFALYLAFANHEGRQALPRSEAIKRLGIALGAVMLGAAIGAIQYLPVREYVDWSPRAGGKGWEHAVSYSMPAEELLNAFIPQFSGMLDRYWGRNFIHFHSEYAGVVVLILASAGMFASQFRRSARWFWMGTLVVSLLWTLGGSTPFYRLIYEVVPGTKFFRAPSTMMYVSMFAVAVLAAFGTERLLTAASGLSRRFVIGWSIAAAALAFVAVVAAVPMADSLATNLASVGYPTSATARISDRARDNQGILLMGAVRSLVFVMLTLGALWLAREGRVSSRALAWVLGALLAVDLWSVERHYWNFSRPAREAFATDPAIEAIKAAPEPGRVAVSDPLAAATPRDPVFYGSAMMAHHVRSTTGYHGNELGRYQRLLLAGSALGEGSTDGLRPEFMRHENVRWLYTTIPDSLVGTLASQLGFQGQFQKVLGPVKNASGSTVYLYRVPGDNRAAVVASAVVKGNDEQALATVLDPRFDARRAAIVDTASTIATAQLTTVPEPSSVEARVTRYESGAITVQLSEAVTTPGSFLVVSENYYPGWQAIIGGQPAEVVRANYNLMGIALPTGARDVELRFRDPAYETGKTVTLLALAASVLLVIVGALRDRRRPVLAG